VNRGNNTVSLFRNDIVVVDGTIDVVVKCSIQVFHKWLVEPLHAFEVMNNVKHDDVGCYIDKLSDVHLGVYRQIGSGLVDVVLIMSDLTKQGYKEPLDPSKHDKAGNLGDLWGAFALFCPQHSGPASKVGACQVGMCAHPNVQPSYDFSENILWLS
jgi:hypothetical protein